MTDIFSLAEELRKELEKEPLFIEYKRVQKLYSESEHLKELKKLIVRAKNENRLEDHKLLKEEFDKDPLVINYFTLEEEVRNYLKEVCDIINA